MKKSNIILTIGAILFVGINLLVGIEDYRILKKQHPYYAALFKQMLDTKIRVVVTESDFLHLEVDQRKQEQSFTSWQLVTGPEHLRIVGDTLYVGIGEEYPGRAGDMPMLNLSNVERVIYQGEEILSFPPRWSVAQEKRVVYRYNIRLELANRKQLTE